MVQQSKRSNVAEVLPGHYKLVYLAEVFANQTGVM